jgi:hypothetical protein
MQENHPLNVAIQAGIARLNAAAILHPSAIRRLLEERAVILAEIRSTMKTLELSSDLHDAHSKQLKASIEFLVIPEPK